MYWLYDESWVRLVKSGVWSVSCNFRSITYEVYFLAFWYVYIQSVSKVYLASFYLYIHKLFQNLGYRGKPRTYMQETLVSQIIDNFSYAY